MLKIFINNDGSSFSPSEGPQPLISGTSFVVYFDQRMGAPHAVHWLKSFVSALKQLKPLKMPLKNGNRVCLNDDR